MDKLLLYCLLMLFAVGNCDIKLIEMSHRYNDNKTVPYPGRSPMKFEIVRRGWRQLNEDERAWTEANQFEVHEHTGTHMDAPAHVTTGPGFARLHEIPIENFIGNGVVIDIRYKADVVNNPNAMLEVEDITRWEEQYGTIPDGSIVFVNSGWDQYWGDPKKFIGYKVRPERTDMNFPGISPGAAEFLVNNRKLKGIGVDTLSLDPGNQTLALAHRTILPSNVYGLENVKNMGKLPPRGARVYVFPINIYDASGGPTRIIAELEYERPSPPYNSANSLLSPFYMVFTMLVFFPIFNKGDMRII